MYTKIFVGDSYSVQDFRGFVVCMLQDCCLECEHVVVTPILDINSENILTLIPTVLSSIRKKFNLNNDILFHCAYGHSRSAYLAIAIIMIANGLRFSDVYLAAKSSRPTISINNGFLFQLCLLDMILCRIRGEKFEPVVTLPTNTSLQSLLSLLYTGIAAYQANGSSFMDSFDLQHHGSKDLQSLFLLPYEEGTDFLFNNVLSLDNEESMNHIGSISAELFQSQAHVMSTLESILSKPFNTIPSITSAPLMQMSCVRCHVPLFDRRSVLAMSLKSCPSSSCPSSFIRIAPLRWMDTGYCNNRNYFEPMMEAPSGLLSLQNGRLYCYNCKKKFGIFNWNAVASYSSSCDCVSPMGQFAAPIFSVEWDAVRTRSIVM